MYEYSKPQQPMPMFDPHSFSRSLPPSSPSRQTIIPFDSFRESLANKSRSNSPQGSCGRPTTVSTDTGSSVSSTNEPAAQTEKQNSEGNLGKMGLHAPATFEANCAVDNVKQIYTKNDMDENGARKAARGLCWIRYMDQQKAGLPLPGTPDEKTAISRMEDHVNIWDHVNIGVGVGWNLGDAVDEAWDKYGCTGTEQPARPEQPDLSDQSEGWDDDESQTSSAPSDE